MKRLHIVLFFLLLLLVTGFIAKVFYYKDVYMLGLNGKVEKIRVDIKERMYLTVSNEEHDLAHFWPDLQQVVEIGDSVYKVPQNYNITLIKANSKKKIICKYREE
jgi:hypothetical protein